MSLIRLIPISLLFFTCCLHDTSAQTSFSQMFDADQRFVLVRMDPRSQSVKQVHAMCVNSQMPLVVAHQPEFTGTPWAKNLHYIPDKHVTLEEDHWQVLDLPDQKLVASGDFSNNWKQLKAIIQDSPVLLDKKLQGKQQERLTRTIELKEHLGLPNYTFFFIMNEVCGLCPSGRQFQNLLHFNDLLREQDDLAVLILSPYAESEVTFFANHHEVPFPIYTIASLSEQERAKLLPVSVNLGGNVLITEANGPKIISMNDLLDQTP